MVRLPRRRVIQPTSDDDPLPYYYFPLTGWAYRGRLEVAVSLLGDRELDNLLEIGYGSGIFLPELSHHCRQLIAMDIHGQGANIRAMLQHERVQAELVDGSVTAMQFADGAFDAVVCLSVLEHLQSPDLKCALAEIRRVTREEGTVILGYPVRNMMMDAFFRVVGYVPKDIHPSGHRDIWNATTEVLTIRRVLRLPRFLPKDMGFYVACECVREARQTD